MSIRHLSYLACDQCLATCGFSDADTAADARAIGKSHGWTRIPRTAFSKGLDICSKCQADPTRGLHLGDRE